MKDLNSIKNLADFILYLQSKNVIHQAPHVGKFGVSLASLLEEVREQWEKE